MFAIISFVIAGVVVVAQNDGTSENKWWFAKKEKPKTEMTEDEEINELNSLINDYEYVEPEETPKERVIREYNQRFQMMIYNDYVE